MASNTLAYLTYCVARELGTVSEGTATGGSTTTVADTAKLTQDDSYWVGGTVWVRYDAAGLGAAPEGEVSVVTAFSSSSDTATVSPAFSSAVAAGDKYAIGKRRYSYDILSQKVNQAILELGPIEVTDTTSISIASSQTEYSLPDIANLDLREIYIQGITTDSNDNQWLPLNDWVVQKSATGTANLLILPQYSSSYALKLVYGGNHAELSTATAEVDDSININKLIYKAASECVMYRIQRVGDSRGRLGQELNRLTNLLEEAKIKFPNPIPSKKPRLLIPLGKTTRYPFKTIDQL